MNLTTSIFNLAKLATLILFCLVTYSRLTKLFGKVIDLLSWHLTFAAVAAICCYSNWLNHLAHSYSCLSMYLLKNYLTLLLSNNWVIDRTSFKSNCLQGYTKDKHSNASVKCIFLKTPLLCIFCLLSKQPKYVIHWKIFLETSSFFKHIIRTNYKLRMFWSLTCFSQCSL